MSKLLFLLNFYYFFINSDFSLQEDDHVLDVLLLLSEYLSLVNELHLGVSQYSPYKDP
jgi:hypothetical protein